MKDGENIKNEKTLEVYNKCAKNFEANFMDLKYYKKSFEEFIKLIKKDSKILDVGCGPGNVAKFLMDNNPNFEITGIDYSAEMVNLAKKNVLGVDFLVQDARKMNFEKNSFNVVMAAFVAPYLDTKELDNFITNISNYLTKNGLFYFSCMEGKISGFEKTSFSDGLELYVNYHAREEIISYFKKNNLEIINFEHQPYPEKDGTFTTDLIFFAKKI
jgi:ubiquinone/menaquinone biosynthesis C-methylase UbiE